MRTYSESGQITFDSSGMDELQNELKKLMDKASDEKALDIVEKGAEQFVEDLLKLPKPRRQIRSAGYTHLVSTFAQRRTRSDIEVGWGKYYGPMVERGTRTMKKSHPHMQPLFNQNQMKYYEAMKKELFQ